MGAGGHRTILGLIAVLAAACSSQSQTGMPGSGGGAGQAGSGGASGSGGATAGRGGSAGVTGSGRGTGAGGAKRGAGGATGGSGGATGGAGGSSVVVVQPRALIIDPPTNRFQTFDLDGQPVRIFNSELDFGAGFGGQVIWVGGLGTGWDGTFHTGIGSA